MIRNLNNEAVYLSNQCDDVNKAIKYLQQALIVCKDIEMSRPVSSFSLGDKRKLLVGLHEISLGKAVPNSSQTSHSHETESVRHLRKECPQHFSPCTLAIIPARGHSHKKLESILCTMPFPIIEAIILFNLGICYLKSEDAKEAQLYFDRTGVVLSRFNSIYDKTSHIDLKVGVLHDLSEFQLSLEEFLRYSKKGSFNIDKFVACKKRKRVDIDSPCKVTQVGTV